MTLELLLKSSVVSRTVRVPHVEGFDSGSETENQRARRPQRKGRKLVRVVISFIMVSRCSRLQCVCVSDWWVPRSVADPTGIELTQVVTQEKFAQSLLNALIVH